MIGSRILGGAGNPLVNAVGRMPVRVRTKLLVAFVGTVVLLVVVGVLGLRVLGQSNDRVERLGTLQLRATAYREIRTDVAEGRVLLGLRAGGKDVNLYAGNTGSAPTGKSLVFLDQTISSTFAQVGPAAGVAQLGFVPPPNDDRILRKIRLDSSRLSNVLTQMTGFDRAGSTDRAEQLQSAQAEPL